MCVLSAYNLNRSCSHKSWAYCHLLKVSFLGRICVEKEYEKCWKDRAAKVETNKRRGSERKWNNFLCSRGHSYLPFIPSEKESSTSPCLAMCGRPAESDFGLPSLIQNDIGFYLVFLLLGLVCLWYLQDEGSGGCHLEGWVEITCWLLLNELSWWVLGKRLALGWHALLHALCSHHLRDAPVATQFLQAIGADHCYSATPLMPWKHSWRNSAVYVGMACSLVRAQTGPPAMLQVFWVFSIYWQWNSSLLKALPSALSWIFTLPLRFRKAMRHPWGEISVS